MIMNNISEFNSDVLDGHPNLERYITKPRKRPKLKVIDGHDLTIVRSIGWFRKQTFSFVKYIDKGIDVLASNFLLFFDKFIKQEREINDTQSLKDLIYLFDRDSIFILPKIPTYIQEVITANNHMYIRFMTMVNSLEILVDPNVISYIKLCYLKSIIKFNLRYFIPTNTNNLRCISSVEDVESVHQYLDMITLFPWSYLLFVYKFNKYSDFTSVLHGK